MTSKEILLIILNLVPFITISTIYVLDKITMKKRIKEARKKVKEVLNNDK